MKQNLFRNMLLLVVLLAAGTQSRAERGDTLINPYFELMHLFASLANDSLYTATLQGQYDITDTLGNHTNDSLNIIYTIQGEKFQSITDSLELVQNDLYNVTVNNIDSIIVISPPRHIYPMLLQGDVLDATFQQNYLDSIRVVDSGVIRNIIMNFKLSSPWYSYLYAYDSAIDFVVIKYKQRHSIPLTPSGSYTIYEPSTDYTALLLVISVATPAVKPTNPFDTSKYFTRSGNTFTPIAPYANYEIINQLSNQ
ncbi:MAG TPA: hypothetical protein VGM41_20590 [Chitinophagaceae bacterium]|jgi:hypothetical protein